MSWFLISIIVVTIAFLYFKKHKDLSSKKNIELKPQVIEKIKNRHLHSNEISKQSVKKKSTGQQNSKEIFNIFNPNSLGNSSVENAIKKYNHEIAFYSIGELDSGAKYALIIGTSDEWLNVITLNWAKAPTYESYGFSIKENRWSYGSKVLGAPKLRDEIKNNLYEIKQKIVTQEVARKEKERKKVKRAAEEERENIEYERIEREEEAKLARVQKYRKPIIDSKSTGINFEYNANKNNHSRAIKECEEHYLKINLENQTCSCEDFKIYNSKHQKYDIRRLCTHLSNIIKYRKLLKKNKNELENFILENLKGNILGVFLGKLEDNRDFAIIAYGWTTDLFVATPKTYKEGYLMVTWHYFDSQWTAKSGGKKINDQIVKTITDLFKE